MNVIATSDSSFTGPTCGVFLVINPVIIARMAIIDIITLIYDMDIVVGVNRD
jgi:hypothetical protein